MFKMQVAERVAAIDGKEHNLLKENCELIFRIIEDKNSYSIFAF